MPQIRLYIAQSLDGFIARPDGSIDWLRPYDDVDYGYSTFIRDIGTVVMGRASYDMAMGFGEWPYAAMRSLVITSSPLENAPPTAARVGADIPRLVTALRAAGDKDIWIMGGARTINAFLAADAIDRIDLFTLPLLLGQGIRLFDDARAELPLRLVGTQTYDKGLTRQSFARA